jgi:hypothetical protein
LQKEFHGLREVNLYFSTTPATISFVVLPPDDREAPAPRNKMYLPLSNPTKLMYKATEHNIDLYAAFLQLYLITGDEVWSERANHARQWVEPTS